MEKSRSQRVKKSKIAGDWKRVDGWSVTFLKQVKQVVSNNNNGYLSHVFTRVYKLLVWMKKKVKAQEMYAEMDENIYGGCREENGNTRTMGMDIHTPMYRKNT